MMGGIIPDKHRRKVFEMLIQSGLDSIVKEGEVNNDTDISLVVHYRIFLPSYQKPDL